MLKALIAGTGAPAEPAELAKRSLRRKRPALAEALTGRVTAITASCSTTSAPH
jgi:hypothetical protein